MGVINIGGNIILPGETKHFTLPIANLPIRTPVTLAISVFRSVRPGPTLLLTGGIHGNELTGIEIIRKMIADKALLPDAGTVIALPLVNPHGFLHKTREFPDGKDLNRSFPGNKEGSLASQVAYVMMHEVAPHADVAVDLHSGGASRFNTPQIRCHIENARELELAKIFGCNFIINSSYREKSFREKTSKQGIPTLVYEGGESLRFNNEAIDAGIQGIIRLMHHLGIKQIGSPFTSTPFGVTIISSSWMRASISGLFRIVKPAGVFVRKHEIIGTISDPYGEYEKALKAPHDGYIIGINNLPIVNKGDAIVHIGKYLSTKSKPHEPNQ